MFCLLVSPDPLRRALLLSEPDCEQSSPASPTVTVGGASAATPPAVSHHVAVDIPEEEDSGGGGGEDLDAEELKTTQHISPLHTALVRAVFVAYTAFAAPPLVATAFTRSSSFLLALLVLVVVALTVVSLYMATLCVYEDEDCEREEADQGLDG